MLNESNVSTALPRSGSRVRSSSPAPLLQQNKEISCVYNSGGFLIRPFMSESIPLGSGKSGGSFES